MRTATLQECKSQVMKPYKMESGKIAALIVAGILALGATPLLAASIVPDDYAKSFSITFPGYSGSETLTDFPVLVKVSQTRNGFDYSACKIPGGGDLRFADSGGNLLSSEIDTWNTSGESLVWVKVPSFDKNTVITAYYGNANPPEVSASDVWVNGYVAVWHLNESAAPLAESSGKSSPFEVPQNYADRTTYATNGVAGGKSVSFDNERYGDGIHIRLEAADDPDLRGLTNFTIECWTYQAKYRDDNGDATIIGAKDNWKLFQKSSGQLSSRWMKANGTTVWGLSTPSGPALNKWTYQTFVRNFASASSADTTWYLNGGSVATTTESNAESTGNGGEIKHVLGGGDNIRVFPGSIDEARVSNVARSADWVKASHDTVVEENFASFAATENDWTMYSHRFRVSFGGYTGSETLTDFPVLVKISESGITGFRYADCEKPGGADLRFADAEGNLLASEVDTWNTSGESLVWVKVPSLTAATKITAYYGWDFAPIVDSKAVWANGYVGVWHMNETGVPLSESSGGSSPLTAGEKPEYANCGATGIVGKSVDFDNYGSYKSSHGSPRVQAADDDGRLSGFTNFTVECWTYQTNYWGAESGVMIGVMAKGNGSDRSWRMYQSNNEGGYSGLELTDSEGSRKWRDAGQCAPSGKWTHQMFVRNRTDLNKCLFYVNGENVASRDDGCVLQLQSNTKPLIVGGGGEGNARIFPGSIDEVRVSNVARSADWVKATHDTVTESSFARYGKAKENVKTGMKIILR